MKQIISLLFILQVFNAAAQNSCESDYTVSIPSIACVNQSHNFSVSDPADGILTVFWDFGDNTDLQTGKSVSHTYVADSYSNSTNHTVSAFIIRKTGATCVIERGIQVFSACIILPEPEPETTPPGNPFLTGEIGNWRVKRTYVFQTERIQTRQGGNDNVDLRTDGTYKNFFPFWNPATASADTWSIQNDERWTFKTQVNHYNPFETFELETVDPLNRFSAAVYGYNYTLPVGVAMNARYREIGFDSFEDYDYSKCSNNHFSFRVVPNIKEKVTETASHSGRRSLRVGPYQNVTLKKEFVECAPEPTPPVIIK